MEWNQFTESPKQYPEVIVENAVKGFAKATNDLVEIAISPKRGFSKLNSKLEERFQFNCTLFSKHLEDYSFTIFELGYDIEIFPVTILMETSIYFDLLRKKKIEGDVKSSLLTEESLTNLLETIFKSDRFTEIVSGLMKIAKKNKLPF